MTDDDEFDQACEALKQHAIQIRRDMQQLARTPREQLPPRAVLEQMRADLTRTAMQLRLLLQRGTVQ